MIKGLDKFKERFAGFEDQYVLIGGTATVLALDAAGIRARQTKDLDIVLSLEALTTEFERAFWSFIKDGGYEHRQSSEDKRIFYRFNKPADDSFPVMLELFSRAPEGITPPADVHLVPIPTDDEVYSLSAILLDSDYYAFLHQHKTVIDGVSVLAATGLIPLKAKAWLDLSERKAGGEPIDSKNIKKHRSDILNLYRLLTAETRVATPDSIKRDLSAFFEELAKENADVAGFLTRVYL